PPKGGTPNGRSHPKVELQTEEAIQRWNSERKRESSERVSGFGWSLVSYTQFISLFAHKPMYKTSSGQIVFSPSDLINYLKSPFSSWMDRYSKEYPGKLIADELSDDAQLVIRAGNEHEQFVLEEFRNSGKTLIELEQGGDDEAATREAFRSRADIIYQAKLVADEFAGYSDFIMLDDGGRYQIWDTKLARSPKPYYAIQLCCYSEMYAKMTGERMPEKFGIILGPDENDNRERVEFRVEDFIHYYRHLRDAFLEMHRTFDGDLAKRPTPDPR